MNFLEALKKCYDGFLIRKATWDEGSYLKYENDTINLHILGTDRTYIYVAYMPDLLKTDWEIYEERKSKTYNFQEAVKAFSDGKIIKRCNKSQTWQILRCFEMDETLFTYGDVLATDWLIMREE